MSLVEKLNSCDSCSKLEKCKIPKKISTLFSDCDTQLPLSDLNDWFVFFLTPDELERINRCPIQYNGKALF